MHIHPFVRLDKGNLHGCVVHGHVCGLLGGVIEKLCVPIARIPVLDYQEARGTEQGTENTKRV
jgi:hypothetical protein